MKQDRFLLGILIGIGALVILALALFFIRKDDTLTYECRRYARGSRP